MGLIPGLRPTAVTYGSLLASKEQDNNYRLLTAFGLSMLTACGLQGFFIYFPPLSFNHSCIISMSTTSLLKITSESPSYVNGTPASTAQFSYFVLSVVFCFVFCCFLFFVLF